MSVVRLTLSHCKKYWNENIILIAHRLVALIRSFKNQKNFSCAMVNAIVCIGIVSNDDYDMLRTFKALKADVLINCNRSHVVYVKV